MLTAYTLTLASYIGIEMMEEPSLPFTRGNEACFGDLRSFSELLSAYRQSHQSFSQLLRENRLAWAKVWNEELAPVLFLADAWALSASDRFRLMPAGHEVDLELITGGKRLDIQVTIADLIWQEASYEAGHLRSLKMRHLADGVVWGGARLSHKRGKTISKPHARSSEDDIEACKAGLTAALKRKCTHDGRGKTLLVFARDFTQHLYDVDSNAFIAATVATAPVLTFDRLCVVDSGIFWQCCS